MGAVPANRVRDLNSAPPNAVGGHVLYWLTACRRTAWNYGLQRAVEWAQELLKPLLVLETLTCGGRWDSDRHRQFVIDGMTDNARAFQGASARYSTYAGPSRAAVRKTVQALVEHSCVLVTDDHPFRDATTDAVAVANGLSIRVEAVDSNGLLPMRLAGRAFPTAYLLRRYLQKTLAEQLQTLPEPHPLAALPGLRLPDLPGRHQDLLSGLLGEPGAVAQALRGFPAGHPVLPVASVRGGAAAASGVVRRFLDERLSRYQAERDHPDSEATSELSPYLSHGHISAHEVVAEILSREGRSPRDLPVTGNGTRSGWWGISASAEAFLDQLVTWRELGLNTCLHRSDYDQFSSLPAWAQQTLSEHQSDVRPVIYSYEEMQTASTHDPLWNAAQRQLVQEGRMHNYLRMLWGKRILEWTPTPQEALEVMVELNNTYALDAEDPNSYTGILWILGRHDRPWGPRRPIFGTVRYMSSEGAARKLRVRGFLQRHGT